MDGEPVERDDRGGTRGYPRHAAGEPIEAPAWTPDFPWRTVEAPTPAGSSYEAGSLTRPVHDQPSFGRPTQDQAARVSAYERERENGDWRGGAHRRWSDGDEGAEAAEVVTPVVPAGRSAVDEDEQPVP